MTHVSFYQLDGAPLDRVLPKLLEKVLLTSKKCLILSPSRDRIHHLNTHLWDYEADQFLPHGTPEDGNASAHPILLSTEERKDNDPDFLFLLDGATVVDITTYARTFIIFDAQNQGLLQSARALWKTYKKTGYTLDYFTYDLSKGWSKV